MADILIPELSENVKAGTVVTITVKVGDTVKKGQTLLELETDKAVLEVPSPNDGVITEVLAVKGSQAKVGQAVFRYTTDAVTLNKPASVAAPQSAAPTISVETAKPMTSVAVASQPSASVAASLDSAEIPAAPSIRRFAREIGVDLSQVKGTEPKGRISIEDVKAHAKALLTSLSTSDRSSLGIASRPLPDFSKWGAVTREPMSAIRKKTAEHMAYCWATVPHVTQFSEADITDLEKVRKEYSTDKLKLSVLPFLIKVIAGALKTFPKFNSSIDLTTQEIVTKNYINIGVAVDTDHGLLVPVIKNADQKTILAIAEELAMLAEKARTRKLSIEDMQGGTFTITNLGSITSGLFTPIVNAPEVAILGVSRASLKPCYDNGPVCAPRLMMPLALSYDHRIIDGADGARFSKWIVDAIKQPFMLGMK